jgi:hypothetical protein
MTQATVSSSKATSAYPQPLTSLPSKSTQTSSTPTDYPDKKCPITEIEATEWCSKAISSVQGCDQICPAKRSTFISTCVFDALQFCHYGNCDDHRQEYLKLCAVSSGYLKESYDPKYVEQAKVIRQEAGFGSNTCKSDCYGHGICSNTGCRCEGGYSGLFCEVDMRSAPAFNVTKPLVDPFTNKLVENPLTSNLKPVGAAQNSNAFRNVRTMMLPLLFSLSALL